MVFGTGKAENAAMSYAVYFACIGALMLLALLIFLWKVREPRFVKEMEAESARWGIDGGAAQGDGSGGRKLSKGERKSLLLILASVVLWFFGYNAVTSKFSVYSTNVLGLDFNANLTIATMANNSFGSSGSRIAAVKSEVNEFINTIANKANTDQVDHRIAIVAFSSGASILSGSGTASGAFVQLYSEQT